MHCIDYLIGGYVDSRMRLGQIGAFSQKNQGYNFFNYDLNLHKRLLGNSIYPKIVYYEKTLSYGKMPFVFICSSINGVRRQF